METRPSAFQGTDGTPVVNNLLNSALMDSALRQSNIQAGLGALTHSDNNEPFIYRFDAVGFVGSLFGENVVQTLSYNATQIMGMFMYDPSKGNDDDHLSIIRQQG